MYITILAFSFLTSIVMKGIETLNTQYNSYLVLLLPLKHREGIGNYRLLICN